MDSIHSSSAHRTSSLLMLLASTHQGERLSLAELCSGLGNRSFGLLLLLFALPNCIPLGIPGLSTLTGIPLALITVQLLLAYPVPVLPGWLSRRSLSSRDFQRLCRTTCPWLARIERLTRPRWLPLTSRQAERWLGLLSLILAIVLILPIPFGNVPPAWALVLLALAMIERDGLLLLLGIALSAASLFWVYGLLWAMVESALYMFSHWWQS